MKLFVCDVEGTIFKATNPIGGVDFPSTLTQQIAVRLGDAAIKEEQQTHKKFESGKYHNYLEWVEETAEIHKKHGLTKNMLDDLIADAKYNVGVERFFSRLDRKEWLPVLISGGYQNLIRRAQEDLDIEYGFGSCEYYFNKDGRIGYYKTLPSDYKGKISRLKYMLRLYNLSIETDWVFVGDWYNDERIATKAPLAFGINPHERLRDIKGLIEIHSFEEIFPHIEKFNSETKSVITGVPKKAIATSGVERKLSKEKKQKQKENDQKGRIEKKNRVEKIIVPEIDYQRNPRMELTELLKKGRVVFLGLQDHYRTYSRLELFKDLKVISGMKNNFDLILIRSSDFLFIYKNCISHATVKHAFGGYPPVCCYLKEHTNKDLIENAMANVLYRYYEENGILSIKEEQKE
jgi:phosphoserine phosphatase